MPKVPDWMLTVVQVATKVGVVYAAYLLARMWRSRSRRSKERIEHAHESAENFNHALTAGVCFAEFSNSFGEWSNERFLPKLDLLCGYAGGPVCKPHEAPPPPGIWGDWLKPYLLDLLVDAGLAFAAGALIFLVWRAIDPPAATERLGPATEAAE
jgi:hypothetical protein